MSVLQVPPNVVMSAGPRSPHWGHVRDEHLEQHPTCAACGGRSHLNVHHKKPFHLHPALELEPKNLITLCEEPTRNCHFRFGHAFDWSAYVPSVEEDSAMMLERVQSRKYE